MYPESKTTVETDALAWPVQETLQFIVREKEAVQSGKNANCFVHVLCENLNFYTHSFYCWVCNCIRYMDWKLNLNLTQKAYFYLKNTALKCVDYKKFYRPLCFVFV